MGVRVLAALAIACALAAPANAATYANGVDVSHYQGLINWTQVAAKSYRFTFAKATEGTTLVDATYPVNRAGSEGMGLRFGAYHHGAVVPGHQPADVERRGHSAPDPLAPRYTSITRWSRIISPGVPTNSSAP